MTNFNPLNFIANHAEMNLADAIKEAYEQGKRDAQPERKTGKWIVTSEFEDCRYVKCNQCKVTQVFYYNKPLTNFCPNCGSYMRGEKDD